MSNKVLSVETGIWWTKVALLSKGKKHPHVYDAFYFRTPENAVEDGYIRDKEVLTTALSRELVRRGIKERTVIFTVQSSKVITREVNIPFVKDKQIQGIVDNQAKEQFPMDITNYRISYSKMNEFEGDNGQKQLKLLLVAVPDNLLTTYYSFAEYAGLTIDCFDYAGNSAVQFMKNNFDEEQLVVQLSEQSTIISMISEKKLVFQRAVPHGFTASLDSVLEHRVFGIGEKSEAYDLLLKHDLLSKEPRTSDFYKSPIHDLDVRQALLQEAVEDIKEEFYYNLRVVNNALDYYKNQTNQDFEGKVYLVGDGARMAGVKEFFEAELQLDFAEEDYIPKLNLVGKQMDYDAQKALDGGYGMLSVVGAVIYPLSILPQELAEKESNQELRQTYMLALGAVALISVGLVVFGVVRYQMALSEQRSLNKKLESLAYIEEIYSEYETAKAQADKYQAFDEMTKTQNERMGNLIVSLENLFPTPVMVQNLSINEDSIALNITCDEKMTAAQLLLNLQEISYITDIAIPSMVESKNSNDQTIWQFSVTARYIDPVLDETAENAQ